MFLFLQYIPEDGRGFLHRIAAADIGGTYGLFTQFSALYIFRPGW